jgi:hypothetical protein
VLSWRVPVFAAVAGLACLCAAILLLYPRPPVRSHGEQVNVADKRPAADASGAAGWHWADGVPGFGAGKDTKTFNITGVQPLEIQAAQLAAIRHMLDPESVRIVAAVRPNYTGVLAILAASPAYDGPAGASCLAALLPKDAPVVWRCPGATNRTGDIAHKPVLVAAGHYVWPAKSSGPNQALYLAGVARGDVYRVVLDAPGLPRETLYTRGHTWGQFEAAIALRRPEDARLLVYGRKRLLEVLRLDVPPGRELALD